MSDLWSGAMSLQSTVVFSMPRQGGTAPYMYELGTPPSMNWERAVKHWRTHRKKTSEWRLAASETARQLDWPRGVHRVLIAARPVYRSPSRFTDTGNVMPAVKAVVDGLVDYGMLVDDNGWHVAEIRMLAPERAIVDALHVQVIEQEHLVGHPRPCGCKQRG